MVSTTVTPAPTADSSSASNREAPLLNIVSPELSSSSFSPPIAAAPLHASEIVHTPPLEEKTTVVAAQTDARAGTKSQIDGSIAILKSSFSKIWLKKYGGITIRSIVQFTIALIFAIGTSLGWVFGALGAAESTRKLRQSGLDAEQPIFIHVLFAVVVAISFALLKLCFSRIRAERYAHTHPGEVRSGKRRCFC